MTEGWHWALIFTVFCLLPIVSMILSFTWPYLLLALFSGENPFSIFVTDMSQRKEAKQMRLGTHSKSFDITWKENLELFTQGCRAAGLSPCEQRKFAEFFRSYPTSSYSFLVEEAREWKAGYGPSLQRDCEEEEKAIREKAEKKLQKSATLKATQAILSHEDFKAVVWEYQKRFRENYRAMLKRDQKKFPNIKPTKLIKEKDWSPYISTNLSFLEDGQLGIIIPAVWMREKKAGQYSLASGIELSVDSRGAIFVPTDKDGDYINGFVFQNLDEFIDHLLEEMEKGNYPLYTSQA